MTVTKYEYVTFTLGEYPTVASKYRKISEDLERQQSLSWYNKDKKFIELLTSIKKEYDSSYPIEDLIMDAKKETDFWIKKLAKQGAVELLAQGKVSASTMSKIASLEYNEFVECVRETTKLSSFMNEIAKKAEREVQPQDIVPADYMK
jgi:predicted HTH domain antitoxin